MVNASASANWNGMSSRVWYPITYGAFAPSASGLRCAGIQRSIFPPFQASCCTSQAWLVDGIAWALVLCVSRWKGSR